LFSARSNLKLYFDSERDAEAATVAGNKTPEIQILMGNEMGFEPETTLSSANSQLPSQDYAKSMLRLEVATYISQMTAELATMARNSDMPLLSYFLDMASAEARTTDDHLRDVLKVGSDPDTRVTIARA
jgi:hypothetical protein